MDLHLSYVTCSYYQAEITCLFSQREENILFLFRLKHRNNINQQNLMAYKCLALKPFSIKCLFNRQSQGSE